MLGFHNVEGTWAFPAPPGTGTRRFTRQLRLLSRLATVVDLVPALDALRSGRPLPPRAVALTFDDGYADNLDVALPILRALRMPATFFLVPSILARETAPWWERLGAAIARTELHELRWGERRWRLDPPERARARDAVATGLKRMDRAGRDNALAQLEEQLGVAGDDVVSRFFLDWDGARELVARGGSVGSHSRAHAILARETVPAQLADLVDSRRLLSSGLDAEVAVLAYPNGEPGDYDEHTIGAAEAAGYRYAVTTISGVNHMATPPFEVRRRVAAPDDGTRVFRRMVKDHAIDRLARTRVVA